MTISNLSIQIGKNIAKYRKVLGITQVNLAELVEMEKENISGIETSKYNLSIGKLEIFAKILHVHVVDLATDDSNEVKPYAEHIYTMMQGLSAEYKDSILQIISESCKLCKNK